MKTTKRFEVQLSQLRKELSQLRKEQDGYCTSNFFIMTKEEIGNQIETLRKELGVSTYELEQKGVHPSLPATIEKGQKGYSIDSLIKYLNAIDEDIFLIVVKKEKKKI